MRRVDLEYRKEQLGEKGDDLADSAAHLSPDGEDRAMCLLCKRAFLLERTPFFDHFRSKRHAKRLDEHRKAVATMATLPAAEEREMARHRGAATCEFMLVHSLPANGLRYPLLQGLLEHGFDGGVPHHSDLYRYVPLVLDAEVKTVRQELQAADGIALVHDGSTVVGQPSSCSSRKG